MAFDPMTGLVYVPTTKLGMRWGPQTPEVDQPAQRESPKSDGSQPLYSIHTGAQASLVMVDSDDGTAALLAWDPVRQSKRWEVRYDSFWNGGVLATAGNLVFQGTGRGHFFAYDARTGTQVWSFDAGLGIIAAPITYESSGVQYVAVLVGYGGLAGSGGKLFDYGWRFNEQPRRLLTFSLGARAALPPGRPPRYTIHAVDDLNIIINEKEAAEGAHAYGANYCVLCHGRDLESTGSIAPDLRESALALNPDAFRAVVQKGELASVGMPKFDDLSDAMVHAIYMYVRQGARAAVAVHGPHDDDR